LGVEPVFASGGPVWPLAGMPAGYEPDDLDVDIPHDAVRTGAREAPERLFSVQRDHTVTHTATEPLAPTKPLPKGGKWNLAIVASCIFHAAIAGIFLYVVDEAVQMEGADFSGVAYLGSGEDQIKAGEVSENVDDAVDVTMVTMLQAKPVETVEAEAVPVEDAAEPTATVEAVTAEAETLQPVSGPPAQQVAEARAEPAKSEQTEVVRAEPEQAVQPEAVQAEPVESRPAPTVTEQVPKVLANDRVELVEEDNVVQRPAEVQAAESVEAEETAKAQPTETEATQAVTAAEAPLMPADSQPAEAVQTERLEAPKADAAESSKVQTTETTQAEPNETEVVKAEAVETPHEAPRPEAKPQQVAEAKPTKQPAERKAAKQAQPKEAPKKEAAETKPEKKVAEGKKAAEKAEPKKTRSGNGGQSQANTRRGQADGQEKGDSKQASKGGSKNGEVGNAAVSNYPSKVRSKLVRAARSVRAKSKGEVVVSFAVGSSGNVQSARVARSSGVASVDQAALQAVRKAAPFPPIPANAGRSSWEFSVPLAFMR